MAFIEGISSNPPYQTVLPVSTSIENGNVVRLCVSQGIPLLSQVSDFRFISYQSGGVTPSNTVIYTCPQGKTFYIMGLSTNIDTNLDSNAIITFGATQWKFVYLYPNCQFNIFNAYPLIIVTQGQTVTVTSNRGNTSVFLSGYEIFGATN